MECLLCSQPTAAKERFSDILFLRSSSQQLCSACHSSFEKIAEQHCPTCYKNQESKQCQDCQMWEKTGYAVQHTALYTYNEAMKAYFSRYKFQGDYLLSSIFSEEITTFLKVYKGYTIVPVPLSPERLAERQFNQVTAFLEGLNVPYCDLLVKEEADKQSSKNRRERLEEASHFHLRENQELPAKIVVVDDIYTTGATLQGICQLLYENGVQDVKTFSLAR